MKDFFKASVFLVLIFSLCFVFQAIAQQEFLILEKTLTDKNIKYSSGDNITFRLKDEKHYRTDHIVALNDTAIEFHYNIIPYHHISHVNIKGRKFSGFSLRSLGTTAQLVGAAYIAVDQFNQVVVRGEEASFNEGVWVAGGLIFLGGSLLKWTQTRKIRLGEKYRLRYMDLSYKYYDK